MAQDKLISKILERKDLIELGINAGIAYTGFRATGHWTGGLAGVVAYRLAQARNLAAGIAGVATLAALGLSAYSEGEGSSPPLNPNWDPLLGVAAEAVAPFWAWFTGAESLMVADPPPDLPLGVNISEPPVFGQIPGGPGRLPIFG